VKKQRYHFFGVDKFQVFITCVWDKTWGLHHQRFEKRLRVGGLAAFYSFATTHFYSRITTPCCNSQCILSKQGKVQDIRICSFQMCRTSFLKRAWNKTTAVSPKHKSWSSRAWIAGEVQAPGRRPVVNPCQKQKKSESAHKTFSQATLALAGCTMGRNSFLKAHLHATSRLVRVDASEQSVVGRGQRHLVADFAQVLDEWKTIFHLRQNVRLWPVIRNLQDVELNSLKIQNAQMHRRARNRHSAQSNVRDVSGTSSRPATHESYL